MSAGIRRACRVTDKVRVPAERGRAGPRNGSVDGGAIEGAWFGSDGSTGAWAPCERTSGGEHAGSERTSPLNAPDLREPRAGWEVAAKRNRRPGR